ncbi:resolvase domain protein [Ktedonobacter racemifer DSM 44963]|uniref:Resolvase domain protein n=2 Tax=Ktedonobacter racemifer TaxID=363277 RepID=D6TDC3_KTERA|nr:resolvase domain protein [Ktedonobacter racemifer DSM 44963]
MLLGRPKGVGKSKLDEYEAEIRALIKNGSTKTWIAQRYGTTRRNLSHWLKQHSIE